MPVMVVMVAVMMVAMMMMAMMSAVLASQSGAGSKQNKSGGDTKCSLTEHSCSPVNQPVRYQSSALRKGFTGNESRRCPRAYCPHMDEGAAGRPGIYLA